MGKIPAEVEPALGNEKDHPYYKLKDMVGEIILAKMGMEERDFFCFVAIACEGGGFRDSDIQFDDEPIIWAFNVIKSIRRAGGGDI